MSKIREEYLGRFKDAYDQLNVSQRLAVDTIEGPVMTIAGPGTGKTQLLAVRIGNILLKTDVLPHNILCLTYTEAGSIAMRKRLLSIIGPDAHNVNIQTFHAFCNNVIKENLQSFGNFRDLQPISEIEEVEVIRSVINKFGDNHPLKRYKGDIYFETARLKSLFATMKQEKWEASHILDAYEKHKINIMDPDTSQFIYLSNYSNKKSNTKYQKGDLNPTKIATELKRFESVLAACTELEHYNEEMTRRERYDYQDMILWVIEKFKTQDDLLAKYQERFQYMLVDEYQDTNGAQNELLFLLAEYWDQPNLFIVGDDDQSIYRFQGANMNSIIDFKTKYNPIEIVLTDNYRSSQKILDKAKQLIEFNNDRLVKKYDYLIKDLTEKRNPRSEKASDPEVIEYQNESQEEVGIIQKIASLYEKGVPYNNIAILYSKHKVVENLVRYFLQKKVPINVKKRVNVLYENEVIRLITILEYLNNEFSKPHSGEDKLFEILHYENFGLSALDIAAINMLTRRKMDEVNDIDPYYKWRNVMNQEGLLAKAGVTAIIKIKQVSVIIEQWINDISNVTIQTLIEKILTEGNILHTLLKSPDKSWKLQLVNTFFDFVKNEAAKTRTFTLKDVLKLVDIMRENGLELPINRIISNENGLNFMTAHGSKGMEFEHVFILRTTSGMWEDKKNGNFKYTLPPTLTASTDGSEIEDDRRLFYVAMTRAKDQLYITYPTHSDDEKPLGTSKFISEIVSNDEKIKKARIDDEAIIMYKAELMKFKRGTTKLIDGELIDKILENFKISATSLNKYLNCKLTFYFETILRVPLGRSATMGFGNAIHYGLEQFFRDLKSSAPRSYAGVSKLTSYFIKGMDMYRSHFTNSEFENYSTHGINLLTDYFTEHEKEWLLPSKYELEYSIPATEYKGVPISGKLDRINIYNDHISVTDYKTGKYDSKKLAIANEESIGGDYWRQIIFYRLLLDGDKRHNWLMRNGIMDFVEKTADGSYKSKAFLIDSDQTETVGIQLVQTYTDIKNHIFEPGCGNDTCKWCNFVMRNMPVSLDIESEDNIENIFDSGTIEI